MRAERTLRIAARTVIAFLVAVPCMVAIPIARVAPTPSAAAATDPSPFVPNPDGHYLVAASGVGAGPMLWAWMQWYLKASIVQVYDNGDTAEMYVPPDAQSRFTYWNWASVAWVRVLDGSAPPQRVSGARVDWSGPGSLQTIAKNTGAADFWKQGYTGEGVDVAVIDSGIADFDEVDFGRLVKGPDLSFDASAASGLDPAYDGLDAYGHGTHMAAIIGGRSPQLALPTPGDGTSGKTFVKGASTRFVGMAPGARLIDVRAGAADGAVDVSQVIAAIDWVVAHKDDPTIGGGLHIRVLNLSYGTDSTQNWLHDPLTAAVENAWRHGIVVVVSAGNDGYSRSLLTDPATDPYIISVGASDSMGTTTPNDDRIADYSSRGQGHRRPDLIAPGTSVVSLAVPGSSVDNAFPGGRVDQYLMRGSGTSQAAAVVSGAVALVLSKYPDLTPDQVKAILINAAKTIDDTGPFGDRSDIHRRRLDLTAIGPSVSGLHRNKLHVPNTAKLRAAVGDGSLELARGTNHVAYLDADCNLQELTGEVDVTGAKWDGHAWKEDAWLGHAWKDSSWLGHAWKSRGWAGSAWQGSTWEGHAWKDGSWVVTNPEDASGNAC